MTAFLAELGTKAADRWLNLLVLPGLVWAGLLAAGLRLGHGHPFDVALLRAGLDEIAAQPTSRDPATVLLAAAAVVLAAAAVGMAASATGELLQRLWVLPGDLPPASWLLSHRRQRWDTATGRLKTAIVKAGRPDRQTTPAAADRAVRRAQRRRQRLGPARPTRPTHIGDRFDRTSARVRDYHLDLDLVWPRLWTVLPDTLRGDLGAAQEAYAAAARLAAWGVLYVVLGAAWWPAAVVGLAVLLIAGMRARDAADVLADLVDTAVDLHTKDLAAALDIPTGPGTADLGTAISQRLLAASTPPTAARSEAAHQLPGTAESLPAADPSRG